MPEPVPSVLYAARSKKGDDDRSTSSQLAEVRARLAHETPTRLVVDEFSDDGYSGSRKNRGPGLQSAIDAAVAAAQEHGACELWAFHPSRFARGSGKMGEARAVGGLFYELRAQGVALRCVEDDEFVTNEMLIGFASRQSSKYAEDLSAHILRGKRKQLEERRRLGGPVPDGYLLRVQRDERDRITAREYSVDPEREPIFRRMFELALGGYGCPAIGRALNAEGYRTKTGGPWTRRRVQATLQSPFYAGLVAQHGERAGTGAYRPYDEVKIAGEGDWPAYLTPERWHGLQAGLGGARDRPAGGRRPEGQRTTRYVLARLGVCDRCGARLYLQTSTYTRKSDGLRTRRYVCGNVHGVTGLCDQAPLDAHRIDAAVLENLNRLFVDFASWSEQLVAGSASAKARLERELETELGALDKDSGREARLRDRYITASDVGGTRERAALEAYEHVVEQREARAARVRALQEALAAQPDEPPVDAMLDLYGALRRAVRDGGQGVGEVNDRLRAVFAEFRVDEVAPGIVGVLPVLREDVIDRFVESGIAAVLVGPEGAKPGDALPPASPVVIFTGGDSLSVRGTDTCAPRTTAARSVGRSGGGVRA